VTSLTVLETFVSLSVQVTLLICLATWVVRKQDVRSGIDWCWATLHVCILALTVAAFLLPHLRLITWADLYPASNSLTVDGVFAVLGRICGWTWLSGSLAVLAVSVGGMFRATALVRNAVADEDLSHHLLQSVPMLNSTNGSVEIRLVQDCVSPFCWQLHRPVIALPDLVRSFPAAEQAAIVRHELAHLRLQHPLHLFLQRLVEAIYWYHPLVWWASRQAAAAREFRCDRETVHSRREVGDYLRSLLRLIESQVSAPSRLPAGLGFLGDTSLLSRRAAALADTLDQPVKPTRRWRPTIAPLIAAGICILVWLPVNPLASRRATWSPWPAWSARALDASGITVRDYEVDGHRLSKHPHLR
jgi:beta-lactamase regulating signal transducer with metallopeptidase domain